VREAPESRSTTKRLERACTARSAARFAHQTYETMTDSCSCKQSSMMPDHRSSNIDTVVIRVTRINCAKAIGVSRSRQKQDLLIVGTKCHRTRRLYSPVHIAKHADEGADVGSQDMSILQHSMHSPTLDISDTYGPEVNAVARR